MQLTGPAALAATPERRRRRVLVAVPCYNEGATIGSIVRVVRSQGHDVLVIDDGSADDTASVARQAGATVLQNPGNRGKGYGIRRAFTHADQQGYDALVLMDGDLQHDPGELPLLLEPILGRNGQSVDISLGFRFGETTEMPTYRRVGKRVLDYATAVAGSGIVTDSQCGYRAFGRRAIREMASGLEAAGFSVESEQLVLARDRELTMENVRISCKYDGLDGSTQNPIRHASGVLVDLVRLGARRRPFLFVGAPSVALLAGGVGLLAADVALPALQAAGQAILSLGVGGLMVSLVWRPRADPRPSAAE